MNEEEVEEAEAISVATGVVAMGTLLVTADSRLNVATIAMSLDTLQKSVHRNLWNLVPVTTVVSRDICQGIVLIGQTVEVVGKVEEEEEALEEIAPATHVVIKVIYLETVLTSVMEVVAEAVAIVTIVVAMVICHVIARMAGGLAVDLVVVEEAAAVVIVTNVVKLVISLVNAPPVVTVVEVEISSVTDVGVWVTWHEIVLLMSNPLFMRMSIPSSLK
ncbi:uncharacterized protein [Watersipora subatra]|uniref:uncharacterized protein isoform X1 n=1 Tax=Watersipora subatra TaxID=2589382 RepID=UPI00355C90EE